MRYLANPRLLLPLIIFFGVLITGLRVNDVWHAVTLQLPFHATELAEAKAPDITPPSLSNVNTGDKPTDASAAATQATAPATAAGAQTPLPETLPSKEGEKPVEDVSSAEMDLLKQLSDRRDQLDKRSQDLDTREALIKVAEQRVDQKIKEMETLRQQLQTMVNQVSESQQAQIENLVKIYETMKPKEAARIFETLEMPVLLGVIQRMKPARTAAVMAEMAPDKAKDVTVALTKQDQLPQAK